MVSVNFQQANTVHLNEGNGRFVALDRGPLTESSCKSSCAVFDDLSNDGKIDLFIGDEGNCLPELFLKAPMNSIFQSMEQNAATSSHSFTELALAFDADGDGIDDILDLNAENTPNMLFKGDGDGGFEQMHAGSLTEEDVISTAKMNDASGVVLDCDNDGDLDVFLSSWVCASPSPSPSIVSGCALPRGCMTRCHG